MSITPGVSPKVNVTITQQFPTTGFVVTQQNGLCLVAHDVLCMGFIICKLALRCASIVGIQVRRLDRSTRRSTLESRICYGRCGTYDCRHRHKMHHRYTCLTSFWSPVLGLVWPVTCHVVVQLCVPFSMQMGHMLLGRALQEYRPR